MFQLLILPVLFLLLSRTPAEDEVKQFPSLIFIEEGSIINITCSTSGKLHGLYLKRSTVNFMKVMYFSEKNDIIIEEDYKNRTIISGTLSNTVITITDIQLNDTDVYTCEATVLENLQGSGTMVVVTEKKQKEENWDQENSWLWVVLNVIFFFIGLTVGSICMKRKTLIKKLTCKRTPDPTSTIYEEMSVLQDTLPRANLYT